MSKKQQKPQGSAVSLAAFCACSSCCIDRSLELSLAVWAAGLFGQGAASPVPLQSDFLMEAGTKQQ